MRKKARIKINSEKFPYKSILRTIVLPPLAIGFTFGGIVILHQSFYNEKFQDDILLSIMLILVGLLCFFLWLTYTIKWSQPTKYEIENGFIEK